MLSFGKHALEVPMSLQPKEIIPVPDKTARVARAAFPKGNTWLSLRDSRVSRYRRAPLRQPSSHRRSSNST
jgi:hypothetical protein